MTPDQLLAFLLFAVVAAVKWLGIAFLLWLSWQIATSRREDAAHGAPVVGFWRAAALQWANPKAWVVSVSAAGAVSALAQSAAFGFLFILAALPSGLLWLAFGSSVQRWPRSDRSWTTFNRAMAALLAASIVLFLW